MRSLIYRKALLERMEKEDRKDGIAIRDAIGRIPKTTFNN